MPKGCDRRIHSSNSGPGFVDLGPLKEAIPVNNGIMPVHYGFIEGTLNKDDGDEVDVLLFSERTFLTGDIAEARAIAVLKRTDNDHKVVAVDPTSSWQKWEDINETERGLVLDFFSSHHVIEVIDGSAEAESYIRQSQK